jgi:hypothetical protein
VLLTPDAAEPPGKTRDVNLALSDDVSRATITGQIVFDRFGTYNMRLAVAEEGGKPVPFGEPVEFRVGWTGWDHAKSTANRAWPFLLLAAHTLFFIGLIAGARGSDRCWRLVTGFGSTWPCATSVRHSAGSWPAGSTACAAP